MKSLMRLACLGAVAMTFVACEEDKHICTLPSFAGFRIEPTVWNAGDSVTITAVQQSLGDLLYKAEYHWSVECTDTTFTKDYNVVYDADKSNPYIGIRLPDDFRGRMAKINFSVQYSYSATAPQLLQVEYSRARECQVIWEIRRSRFRTLRLLRLMPRTT